MATVTKTVEVEVEVDVDVEEYEPSNREINMRLDLYRAIYAGDMEKAEDMANLMAMVDIDRDIIWNARREVRVK